MTCVSLLLADSPDVVDEGSVRAYSSENSYTCYNICSFKSLTFFFLSKHLAPDGGMPFIPLSQDTYNSHSAPVTHCKFSPTAKNIATADTDGVLK